MLWRSMISSPYSCNRVGQHAIAARDIYQSERFVGNEAFIQIAQSDFALRFSVVDIHSGKSVSTAPLKIGVEIHKLTAQSGKSIAMP